MKVRMAVMVTHDGGGDVIMVLLRARWGKKG